MNVRIKKLAAVDNPNYPTPRIDEYIPGENNGIISLPVEYEIKGEILNPPTIGFSLNILRNERNGVVCDGLMCTSKITKIEEGKFYTQNSIYEIEYLE